MKRRPRLCVIGAGHLGTYHLQKLASMPEVQLVGVVEQDGPRRERAAATFGIETAPDLEHFADRVDAAVVATPTTTHLEVAAAALELGWDVLVEKPIAHTAAAGRELVKLAEQHGRVLQVGHTERFNPAIAAALQVCDRPRYIVTERLGPFTGRSTDVDVVVDLMIHDLDIVASLVPSPVVEVRAVGVPVLTAAIDMAAARIAFADGTVAQLSAGRASLELVRKIRLFTCERYMSIDCAKHEVKAVRRLPPLPGSSWPQIVSEPITVPTHDALAQQDAHFVACVSSRSRPRVDGAAGLRALELAEAVKYQLSASDVAGFAGLEAAAHQLSALTSAVA